MKKILSITIILLAITIIASIAGAWSYVRVGNNYIITLDSGHRVNVTSYDYVPSTKYLSATLKPLDGRLTIQEVAQIANITQSLQDTKDGKKNVYIRTTIVQ